MEAERSHIDQHLELGRLDLHAPGNLPAGRKTRMANSQRRNRICSACPGMAAQRKKAQLNPGGAGRFDSFSARFQEGLDLPVHAFPFFAALAVLGMVGFGRHIPGEVFEFLQCVSNHCELAGWWNDPQPAGSVLFGEQVLQDQIPFAIGEVERQGRAGRDPLSGGLLSWASVQDIGHKLRKAVRFWTGGSSPGGAICRGDACKTSASAKR
jgi:hypothetical protein